MQKISHYRCLILCIFVLSSCYEPPILDYSKVCVDNNPICLAQDADGDRVKNGEDDFPFDRRCSQINHENCEGCGIGCEVGLICLVLERRCG